MNIMVIILLISAIIFAYFSQKNKTYKNNLFCGTYENFFIIPFIISFFILAFLCFFCKSGTDMPIYVNLYSTWTLSDLFDLKFEIGDKILFIFLHIFIKNPYIGIGIVKVLSVSMIFKSFYLLKNRINICMAVTVYTILLYIFNFHLIRMMIAVGIVFLALTYEIIGKRFRCFILLVIAIFFHYSSCIILFTYIVYVLFSKKFSIKKILVILIGIAYVYSNAIQIVSSFIKIDIFSKYSTYGIISSTGTGIVQILQFIPVAIILLIRYKYENKTKFYQISFFCGIMLFLTGSMGYIYAVIGRLTYYFYFFFVIYGASTPLKKNDIIIKCGKIRYNMSMILIFVLIAMKVYIYYILGNGLNTNGLLNYISIFA